MTKLYIALLLLIVFFGGFLRFYRIDQVPPGLYIDEIGIGYNAYTILQTGKDEYGTPFPLAFRSYDDYKMPLYIYSTAISIALFGKNDFAVRFPSAISGTLTILVLYFFLKRLLAVDKKSFSDQFSSRLSLLACFLLTISPWHIQFSRGGFEATLATFLFLLASYLALVFFESKKIVWLLSSMFIYTLTMYTYHVFRIIAPLTILSLLAISYKTVPGKKKMSIFSFLFFILLGVPLFLFSFTPQGGARFTQVFAFFEYANSSLLAKVLYYPLIVMKNFFSFFSFSFLFVMGDGNGRHQVPGMGLFFRWQLPFFLIGIYSLFRQKKSSVKYILLFLLFVFPLAASVANPSPHTLRVLPIVIPITILITLGIFFVFANLNKNLRGMCLLFFVLLGICEFGLYLHLYYGHYPKVNIMDWGGENERMVKAAGAIRKNYDYLVVDSNLSVANEYFNFYNDSLSPIYADVAWKKPDSWKGKKVLYIRRYYGPTSDPHVIKNIYMPNQNNDIFAQFWEL